MIIIIIYRYVLPGNNSISLSMICSRGMIGTTMWQILVQLPFFCVEQRPKKSIAPDDTAIKAQW